MKLLGCDVGRKGAIALLDTETDDVLVDDIQLVGDRTLDCLWLMGRLIEWEPVAACIENVFKDPRLIELKGEVKACFKLANIPLTSVAPSTWKKRVLGENTSDKERSLECVQRLYPQANILRPTPAGRKTNPNHDRAEAVLQAHYLKLLMNA